jgi:hypothetical protein
MLMGVGDGTKPNIHGERPWVNNNPLTPNQGYFRNVDAVVQIAREHNLVISLTLYHQRYRKYITLENARAWAKWVATRYKDIPTIVWSMTPEARQEFVPILRELAAGLHEGDGGAHLITFKPDPAPYSSELHPRRGLARLRLDADVEERRADLSHGDQGLQSEARETSLDGGRGL